MAKTQVVSYSYTCDVCGSTIDAGDDASRKFSWEGTDYVLDVCEIHDSELDVVLGRLKGFVESGQRASGRRGRRSAAAATTTSTPAPRGHRTAPAAAAATARPKRKDLGTVRAWARANGFMVSERGRIQAALLAAYDAANRESDEVTASASELAPVTEPESAPPPAPTRDRTPRKAKATVG